MDAAERSAALVVEGRRLIDCVAAGFDREVPSCPGWEAVDLLGHIAGGWEALRLIVEQPSTEPPDFASADPVPEEREALASFARERLDRLAEVIAECDEDRPVWTYVGERPMAFWPRRAHLETLVHRIDAEGAATAPTPVDPWAAIDGVDELYGDLLAGRRQGLPDGSLHLHQTDGDGEFMLEVVDGKLSVSHRHAKGDAALRATGEELLCAAWRRRDLDGLELFGDRGVAEQWMALSP